MTFAAFDRFFTERVPEAIRGLVYEAIATAHHIAFGQWFAADDGCPCLTIRAAMGAVGEVKTIDDFPEREDEFDNEHQERWVAQALGVTEQEVRSIWVRWDGMTDDERAGFIARMKARHAARVHKQRTAVTEREAACV
jgi:hypothetical protein